MAWDGSQACRAFYGAGPTCPTRPVTAVRDSSHDARDRSLRPASRRTGGATWAPLSPKPALMERRYDLDWIRICAFALLVLYHVGMYYVTWDWHVNSPYASHALEPLMLLSSPWRLSLL